MAEYGSHALRWAGTSEDPVGQGTPVPYQVHERYGLTPTELLGIFVPNVAFSWPPYIGMAAFALALLGAALAWRTRPEARWLAAIALGGIVFSLGANSILHGAVYALFPLVDKARVPAAATIVFALGIAPLAAFGLDLIQRPENHTWSRRAGWWLAGVGAAFAAAAFVFFTMRIETATGTRTIIPAVGAFLTAAVLAAWRGAAAGVRAGSVVLIGLALFEIANVTNYNFPHRNVPEQNPYLHHLGEHADLIGFITSQREAARIDYDDQAITYAIGSWYGVETLKTFGASVTANIWSMDLFSPLGQDFFGVRYYLGTAPSREGQIEAFQGASGVKVFENPSALRRVWAVHEVTRVTDARAAIANAEINPRTTAFVVDGEPPALTACENAEPESVEMPIHQPSYVRIEAQLSCRGMVILTDTFYRGWRATVDGRAAEIHEVYGGVRGVIAEAGPHVIEMRYRPWSVLIGLLLSLSAALIAAGSWWRSRGALLD
jgi:hypothetical protein